MATRCAYETGTYRTPDGKLVHCVLRADGELDVEAEERRPAAMPLLERELVKLSDDPFWPDRWDRDRGTFWPTD